MNHNGSVCTTLSYTMSHQDDTDRTGILIAQQNVITEMILNEKRLEKELAETKERCEKLEKAMKYSPSGESLLSKFIQATQNAHEAREEIRLLKAIMDMMKDKSNE